MIPYVNLTFQIKRLRNSRILSLSKVGDGEKCVKQSVWDTEPFLALGWAVKGIVTALLQAGTKNMGHLWQKEAF